MPGDDLTVILVSFNSADTITDRHDALCSAGSPPVIIVDNASPDGSADTLANRYPHATILRQPRNLGYGRAANVGLHAATTPYALLLNPDLSAPPAEVHRLLDRMKAGGNRVALAGPAVSNDQHQPDAAPEPVDLISGCAMLFHIKSVLDLGGFDKNIFLYSEETELCTRVRQAGHTILYCPDVYFEHDPGTSSGSSPAIEYLRWWHFGWSNAYRITKHKQATLWKHPLRKKISARLSARLSRDPLSRAKWNAKADGYAAFLRGEKAFDADGYPMMSRVAGDAKRPAPPR